MATEKQRKTFLSYSRVNKDFAIRLAQELKAEGFDIWLDQLDIQPGAWWDDEVERALEECEIFMVIITPSSSASKNVKDEIGYALDNQKRILPVLLENATLPLRLRRLQYVDFTAKNFDDGVNAAKDLLRKLMAQPTLPRIELSEEERQQLAQADMERREKAEAEQRAAQKAEEERLAQQKAEERAAKARAEEEHFAKQKADEEQLAKAEAERKAKAESKRKAKEEAELAAKAEAERVAAQKAEADRLAKQKAEDERIAKAESERKAQQEAERLEAHKAEEQRLAKQKADEELAAKARADREARAEAERAAKSEAERLSRKQTERAGKDKVQAETAAVPVSAVGLPSAPVPATSRKPIPRGLMYGVAAFVLVCSGIGYGILSSLNKQPPSSPANQVANTAVKTPTDVPDRAANPTNTSTPIPERTAVPSRTPVPTVSTKYFTEQFDQDPKWKYFLTNGDEKKLTSTFSNGLMIFELQDLSIYVYFIYEKEEYRDVRIDMRAENRGKNNNNVSLVCRATNAGWYEFSTEGGGVWYLYKATVRENNLYKTVYTTIGNGGAVSLKQGKEVNDYAMICQDNELTLIVNGQELATVRDPNSTFPSGNVGFNISSLNVTPIIVDVDWFKISEP